MASGDRDRHHYSSVVCVSLSGLPCSHLCSFIQLCSHSGPLPPLLLSVVNGGSGSHKACCIHRADTLHLQDQGTLILRELEMICVWATTLKRLRSHVHLKKSTCVNSHP